MAGEEKRRFSRIFFNVRARLEVGDRTFELSRIANLSVGGCLIECDVLDADLTAGQECLFKILLDHMAPPVKINGEIVRVKEGELGIKFTSIDPDNLFHLQNIIRYNAADPDKIEEELSAHPGLK